MFDVVGVLDLACAHCQNLHPTQIDKSHGLLFCHTECRRQYFEHAEADAAREREPLLTDKFRLVWSDADGRSVVAVASSAASFSSVAARARSKSRKKGSKKMKKTKDTKKPKKDAKAKKEKEKPKDKKPKERPPAKVPPKRTVPPPKKVPTKAIPTRKAPPPARKAPPKKVPAKQPTAPPPKQAGPAAGGGNAPPPATPQPVPITPAPNSGALPPANAPPPPATSAFGPDARATWNPERGNYDIYEPNDDGEWSLVYQVVNAEAPESRFSVRRLFQRYDYDPTEITLAQVDWLLENEAHSMSEFKRDLLSASRRALRVIEARMPESTPTGRKRNLYQLVQMRKELSAIRPFVMRIPELTQELQSQRRRTFFMPISSALTRNARLDTTNTSIVKETLLALTFPGTIRRKSLYSRSSIRPPLRQLFASLDKSGDLYTVFDSDNEMDFITFELRYAGGEKTLRFRVVVWDIEASNGTMHLIDAFPALRS